MINDINSPNNPNKGKAMAGVILLAIGGILLLKQFAFFLVPGWIFSWPMIFIAWGLYSGAKSNYKNSGWTIMVFFGVIFLLNENIDNADRIVWPIAIIGFGLWLILRKGKHGNKPWDKNFTDTRQEKAPFNFDKASNPEVDYEVKDGGNDVPPNEPYTPPYNRHSQGDDFLDTVSIFGGVNKTILSKNFKGGDIVNIFGGAELDFTQADINGRVYLDITQIFGGTKIIVPSNWQVVSDLAAVFASVDDKRIRGTASGTTDKILVLKGVSIFAGVDIRSY